MVVYTRMDRNVPNNNFTDGQTSPVLLFQKWQAWDEENNQFKLVKGKFTRDDSRLPYLQKIAEAVQNVYQNTYSEWQSHYIAALEATGVDISIHYPTVWRLLVGWGSNPALEAGMTLHHLYGFPYIPGSAVKGLLHHIAEMEVMEILPQATFPPDKEKLLQALRQLQLIKILFGSIHLEQGANKKTKKKEFGPECPLPRLEKFKEKLPKADPEWKEIVNQIENLLDKHTGGMLCFYDAVPEVPESTEVEESQENWLLQTDIVNCHYNEYYSSEGKIPPSDDQNPNPVTFLAVKPGTDFTFPFRLSEWPIAPGRDKEEEERLQVLQAFTRQTIIAQVAAWLRKALGEFGLGAKTAAGYGYFKTGANPARTSDTSEQEVIRGETEIPVVEPAITAKAPKPLPKRTSSAPIPGIKKEFDLALWNRFAWNEYINTIEGGNLSGKKPGETLPARKISRGGKTLEILYQNGRLYCPVKLTLQGVQCAEEAQWVWENVVKPELLKLSNEAAHD